LIKRALEISYQEIDRVGVAELVESKKFSQHKGSKQLGISSRQMRRLQQRYRKEGISDLISKHRGKPSNNQLQEPLNQKSAIWYEKNTVILD
jgi:transposase